MLPFQTLLKDALAETSMPQVDVAKLAGISTSHLTDCLKGRRAPTRQNAERLAGALKLSGQTRADFLNAAKMAKAQRKAESKDHLKAMLADLEGTKKLVAQLVQLIEADGTKIPHEIDKQLKRFMDR